MLNVAKHERAAWVEVERSYPQQQGRQRVLVVWGQVKEQFAETLVCENWFQTNEHRLIKLTRKAMQLYKEIVPMAGRGSELRPYHNRSKTIIPEQTIVHRLVGDITKYRETYRRIAFILNYFW